MDFVDVGALHPINGSLTYNLYKKGWNGVNIDMLEKTLNYLKFSEKEIEIRILLFRQMRVM